MELIEYEKLVKENNELKRILNSPFTSTNFCQFTKQQCSNPLARSRSCSECRISDIYDDY